MRLPDLPVGDIRQRREMVTTRGINYADNIQDGDLAECTNLSGRRWPYLATRNKRAQQEGYAGVTALTSWNGLVAVQGTDLLYKGQVVGQVTAGEKQFATINTRLVIWPDQVYLDMSLLTDEVMESGNIPEGVIKKLGAKAEATEATVAVYTENNTQKASITLTGTTDLTTLFHVGDGVELSGFSTLSGNNMSFLIETVEASKVTVISDRFTAGTETGTIVLERKIPPLDFICESGNRLWGCSNEQQTIWISALGDPTNFNVDSSISTGSFAFGVGTEGEFTGCCKLSTSVLFWKERALHKVLGDYPAEYVAFSYDIEGLRAGCHRSLTIINDVLFYVGLHGVFTYTGGTPADISAVFGTHNITDAVGGTDGEKYYLSALDNGKPALYVFDPNTAAWLKEDSTRFISTARMGKDVYLLREDGTVWLEDAGTDDPDVDWSLEYTPFYEIVEGRKRMSRLMLRVEMPKGAWLKAETSADKKKWEEAGKVIGTKEDAVSMVIQPNRCDQYRVRLNGHGPCVIKAVLREFISGGYG